MTNEITNVTVKDWNLHKMENLENSRGCFEIKKLIDYNNFVLKIN